MNIENVNDTESAKFYLGKRVAFITKATVAKAGSKFRVVWGKITRTHGSSGVVRAKFRTNLTVSLAQLYYCVRFSCIMFFLVCCSLPPSVRPSESCFTLVTSKRNKKFIWAHVI
jgi:hypothetical protein